MQTTLSQPSIEIFGTTIAEPMVTLTDLMITAIFAKSLDSFAVFREFHLRG